MYMVCSFFSEKELMQLHRVSNSGWGCRQFICFQQNYRSFSEFLGIRNMILWITLCSKSSFEFLFLIKQAWIFFWNLHFEKNFSVLTFFKIKNTQLYFLWIPKQSISVNVKKWIICFVTLVQNIGRVENY